MLFHRLEQNQAQLTKRQNTQQIFTYVRIYICRQRNLSCYGFSQLQETTLNTLLSVIIILIDAVQ